MNSENEKPSTARDSAAPGDAHDRGTPDAGEEPHEDEAIAAGTLSPAVRRLVKQYDFDVTGIRGSGPSGRIRVGDVMQALGTRVAPAGDDDDDDESRQPRQPTASSSTADQDVPNAPASTGLHATLSSFAAEAAETPAAIPADAAAIAAVAHATTLFECDLGSVAAHRQRTRERGLDFSLTSYFVVACARALRAVPEVHGAPGPVHMDVVVSTAGQATITALRNAEDLSVGAVERQLSASKQQAPADAGRLGEASHMPEASQSPDAGYAPAGERSGATFRLHDYGGSGSILAIPTPLRDGHAASLGLGRPRREIVIRNGADSPRAAAVCYVTLTFDPARVSLEHANACLANLVRDIERWPLD